MPHKIHSLINLRECLIVGLLLGLSFITAISIHRAEFDQIPGLTQIEASTENLNQEITVTIGSFEVVGITAQIDLSQTSQVDNLWSQFTNANELHESLDWNEPHTAIAVYHQIDESFQTAHLLIGYPADQLSRPTEFSSIQVPTGDYRHYELENTASETIARVWSRITKSSAPLIVIERYGLDSWGNPRRIQIQTLEKS